jgi:hypothetical protein
VTPDIEAEIKAAADKAQLMAIYGRYPSLQKNSAFLQLLTNRKKEVA